MLHNLNVFDLDSDIVTMTVTATLSLCLSHWQSRYPACDWQPWPWPCPDRALHSLSHRSPGRRRSAHGPRPSSNPSQPGPPPAAMSISLSDPVPGVLPRRPDYNPTIEPPRQRPLHGGAGLVGEGEEAVVRPLTDHERLADFMRRLSAAAGSKQARPLARPSHPNPSGPRAGPPRPHPSHIHRPSSPSESPQSVPAPPV